MFQEWEVIALCLIVKSVKVQKLQKVTLFFSIFFFDTLSLLHQLIVLVTQELNCILDLGNLLSQAFHLLWISSYLTSYAVVPLFLELVDLTDQLVLRLSQSSDLLAQLFLLFGQLGDASPHTFNDLVLGVNLRYHFSSLFDVGCLYLVYLGLDHLLELLWGFGD